MPADNETKRDADTEAEFLRDAFVAFSHQHDFKPGMIVREKVGCSLLHKSGNGFFAVLELRDDEPLFDVEALNGTAGDGDPTLWVDRRCLELMPEELLGWR